MGAEASIEELFLTCILDGGSGKISAIFKRLVEEEGHLRPSRGDTNRLSNLSSCPRPSPSLGDFLAKTVK